MEEQKTDEEMLSEAKVCSNSEKGGEEWPSIGKQKLHFDEYTLGKCIGSIPICWDGANKLGTFNMTVG